MSESLGVERQGLNPNPVQIVKRSPRKYPWTPRRPPAPPIPFKGRTPFNAAMEALFPWSIATYPGILKGASTTLLGRVRDHCIRDWRRGTRRAPQWAIDLAAAAIRERMASLEHALAILEKEKGRE